MEAFPRVIIEMRPDFIKEGDQVVVKVFNPEGEDILNYNASGDTNIEEAIGQACNAAGLGDNATACVFEVVNETTGVAHSYRLNAHMHVTLIPEEY